MDDLNTVEIVREGKTKIISKQQWDFMVNEGATHGWQLASNLNSETEQVDKKLEKTAQTKAQEQVSKLKEENVNLKATQGEKDYRIKELEELVASLETKDQERLTMINDLQKELSATIEKAHGFEKTVEDQKGLIEELKTKYAELVDENKSLKKQLA